MSTKLYRAGDNDISGACVPVGAAGSHNDVVLEITFTALWTALQRKHLA
jgi:hypothetical protein